MDPEKDFLQAFLTQLIENQILLNQILDGKMGSDNAQSYLYERPNSEGWSSNLQNI